MPHRAPLFFAALACLLATVACGDEAPAPSIDSSGTSGQAGASGSTGDPLPPAPPVLTPCPERWTETTLPSGVVSCEPGPLPDWTCPPGWKPRPLLEGTPRQYSICEPPELPDSCPEGTMPVLGESACQPVGDPCPAGDFPEGLPGDKPILYVKAGASGGDGSEGKPFGKISEAVKAAKAGTVVAIGKGVYVEAVAVGAGKDVSLWGACAAQTQVQGVQGSEATILAEGTLAQKARLILKNLKVTGPLKGIKYARASGEIEGVILSGNRQMALHASHATLNLRSVEGGDTSGDEQERGWGMFCEGAAQIKVERAFFHHNRDIGVIASDPGTSLSLSDVIVQDTQAKDQEKTSGWGLCSINGAQVSVNRALFDGNRETSVAALDPETAVWLDEVVIKNTRSAEKTRQFGWGLLGDSGAQITAEHTLFERNRSHAVFLSSAGTSLQLRDVALLDTESEESTQTSGRGLEAQGGAQAKVERALFLRNRDVAVFAVQEGTRLDLIDTLIESTRSEEIDKTGGRGLAVQEGALAKVERVLFHRNRDVAAFAAQEGTSLAMMDVVIRETQGREADDQQGSGLLCQQGAQVTAKRVLLDHNRNIGAGAILAGTTLTMSDVLVQHTQSGKNDEYGIGLLASSHASVALFRSLLRENRVAALLVQTGAHASLQGVRLDRTTAGNFTPAGEDGLLLADPIRGVGDGLVVVDSSSVTATDLLSSGHQRSGLLFVDSSGTLSSTSSTGNQFGLVLRGSSQPSHDETCSFEGNETPILPDGDLPVPNAPLQTPPPLD